MPFSETINGTHYTDANFEDLAYTDPDTGILALVSDVVAHAGNAWRGVSGSSHSETAGSKTFALTTGRAFAVGAPIVAISSDGVVTLLGEVTAYDDSAPSVTVDVTSSSGSGTKTLWNIYVAFWSTSTISNPGTLAQGCLGADLTVALQTGLNNVEASRLVLVEAIYNDPPAIPLEGLNVAVGSAPTGIFVGHEGEIARYRSAAWSYEDVDNGVLMCTSITAGDEGDTQSLYLAISHGDIRATADRWLKVSAQGAPRTGSDSRSTTSSIGVEFHDKLIRCDATAGTFVLTLPARSSATWGMRVRFIQISATNAVQFNVSGGGKINGSSSTQELLDAQWECVYLECGSDGAASSDWYITARS